MKNKLPTPSPAPHTLPYWEGAKRGELSLPYCLHCQEFFFYPRVVCPTCFRKEISFEKVSPRGTLQTYSTLHRAPTEAFEPLLPYTLGIVRLEVGVRMLMEIRAPVEKLRVGAEGTVQFAQRDEFALPYFSLL